MRVQKKENWLEYNKKKYINGWNNCRKIKINYPAAKHALYDTADKSLLWFATFAIINLLSWQT